MKNFKKFIKEQPEEESTKEFSEEEFSKEFSEFSDQEKFIKEYFEQFGIYPSKDILEVRKIGLRRLNRVGNKNLRFKPFSEKVTKENIEKS